MMAVSAEGTFHVYGSKGVVSVPSKLWRDSSFPFSDNEKVSIVIDGNRMEIFRKKKGQKILEE